MRQLITDARNISHIVNNTEILTMLEAVITTVEKKMVFIGAGLVNEQFLETFRFSMTIQAAKELRDHLDDWILDAEEEHERVKLERKKD